MNILLHADHNDLLDPNTFVGAPLEPRRSDLTGLLFVDSGAQKPEAGGAGSAVVYDAGMAYLVSRDIQVDLSVGAHGTGSTPPRSFAATGLSIQF